MATTLPMPPTGEHPSLPTTDPVLELPELKVQRRKLPTGIATNVKQHVLLVRDRSSSMYGHKIAELNQASESLVRELSDPQNRDGFRISVIDFNNLAHLVCLGESSESLTIQPAVSSGGTDFMRALRETLEAIQAFKNLPNSEGWHYLRPVVLFLSDGQSHATDDLIQEVQEEAEVIAIAYGMDADVETLQRIASNHQVEVIGTDGGALRAFLAQVGKTLSQAIQANR